MAFQQNQSLAYAQQGYQINAEDKPVVPITAVVTGLSDAYYSRDKTPTWSAGSISVKTNNPIISPNDGPSTTGAINVKGSSTVVN